MQLSPASVLPEVLARIGGQVLGDALAQMLDLQRGAVPPMRASTGASA